LLNAAIEITDVGSIPQQGHNLMMLLSMDAKLVDDLADGG
jgi:hypothetical protein